MTCRSIDVVLPAARGSTLATLGDQLLAELTGPVGLGSDSVIAHRGRDRWVQTFETTRLTDVDACPRRLRPGGVYLITGGLGGIGLTLAHYLAQTVQAKLILTGRSAFPARDAWNGWLATHEPQDSVRSIIVPPMRSSTPLPSATPPAMVRLPYRSIGMPGERSAWLLTRWDQVGSRRHDRYLTTTRLITLYSRDVFSRHRMKPYMPLNLARSIGFWMNIECWDMPLLRGRYTWK